MKDAYTTMVGFVGNDVDFYQGESGNARATFRLASTPRFFDSAQGEWRDRDTVWLTVKVWRGLAANVASSVRKGEPVIVYGRLSTYSWRDDRNEERSRLEIDAISVGHDLSLGTSAFLRRQKTASQTEQQRRGDASARPQQDAADVTGSWPQHAVVGQRASVPEEAATT
ncbi:MAG: single-stranded DNA-binding protein [Actinomycetota bacterium]|nr:single-stranded DNA-binding protein [Actinomycetota bacterium]